MADPRASEDPQAAGAARPNPLAQVPVEVTVSVGRARPLIGELLRLGHGAVLPLDRKIDDPVDLFVGDRLIARGLLEELPGDTEGRLVVRLTEVADLQGGF
jgi:flagellar motor switch protein FliN/FliY